MLITDSIWMHTTSGIWHFGFHDVVLGSRRTRKYLLSPIDLDMVL